MNNVAVYTISVYSVVYVITLCPTAIFQNISHIESHLQIRWFVVSRKCSLFKLDLRYVPLMSHNGICLGTFYIHHLFHRLLLLFCFFRSNFVFYLRILFRSFTFPFLRLRFSFSMLLSPWILSSALDLWNMSFYWSWWSLYLAAVQLLFS